ncbi:MAG: hypothetical protein PHQ39_11285 [Methanothrix soehngenii]|nr:hypothetical protein [Methanothrix soehngenii]
MTERLPARCETPTRKRARAHARGQLGRQVRELVQRCERLYLIAVDIIAMFAEYIQAAMDQATYEIIGVPEPFYGQASGRMGNRQNPGRLPKGARKKSSRAGLP